MRDVFDHRPDRDGPASAQVLAPAVALEGEVATLLDELRSGRDRPEVLRGAVVGASQALGKVAQALTIDLTIDLIVDLTIDLTVDAAEREDDVTAAVPGAGPSPGGPLPTDVLEVTAPVLGVDGCKAGWVGALLEPGAPRPRIVVAATIAALVETVRRSTDLRVVGIDIPIGLPDTTTRQADALVRRALVGKASSVFSTLTRPAYATDSRLAADAVNRQLCGQGVGAQAFALRRKILEVDAWMRTGPTVRVIEVHPELSFATMAGAPILSSKKVDEGRRARLTALRQVGVASPSVLSGSGYAADDVLDACSVAWSAARHASGLSVSRPAPPEVFSDGIAAAIWT